MLISAIHADVPVFKNVSKRSTTSNYHPVSLLYAVSKVFANNTFVDNQEINGLFLISSMVSGVLGYLPIFWQL